jgi:hypothetical protein
VSGGGSLGGLGPGPLGLPLNPALVFGHLMHGGMEARLLCIEDNKFSPEVNLLRCYVPLVARIVVVQLTTSRDAKMCADLAEALGNFFSLVCSLTGPCVIRFIGLVAVGEFGVEVSWRFNLYFYKFSNVIQFWKP